MQGGDRRPKRPRLDHSTAQNDHSEKPLIMQDQEALAKTHSRWEKGASMLTFSLLSETSDFPLVSRFTTDEAGETNRNALVVGSSSSVLRDIMKEIKHASVASLATSRKAGSEDCASDSSDLYSDLESSDDETGETKGA